MKVIPAIDIQNGECVRLEQGQFDKADVYGSDPLEMAIHWEEQGAERLHVVDLDGARTGAAVNKSIIEKIINRLSIPVQIGGGLRNYNSIASYIEAGADRVIVGTAALKDRQLLTESLHDFSPDKIAVSLDVKGNKVAIRGWQETTENDVFSVIKDLHRLGVKIFIYTDISRDGMLTGPDLEGIKSLQTIGDIHLIASGGISSAEDLRKLEKAEIKEAIVGRALYTGDINLNWAQKLEE